MFPKVFIGDESLIENSILFEGARIGNNCRLDNCIVEKYVTIPDNTQIGINAEEDKKRFHISEKGIVVIAKDHKFTDA
jgi:glucose-1-phosphate adenylyltransferase